jgi:zinc protease
MNIWVNVGGYNELDAESGMSHFIEHLLFKGTPNLGPGEGASRIEASGGNINAYTDRDNTVLTASVASRFVETMISVVSDTALNATFPPDEVERERQVILEEIRKDLDEPQDRLSDLLFEKAFPGHPYGKPVIGTMEKIGAYTRDDLYRYYTNHYRPDNMTAVLVGDFEPAAVKPMIERYLGATPKSSGGDVPVVAFPTDKGVVVSGIDAHVHTAYLYIAFNTPPVTHDDLFALDVASLVLGRGRDSRLYRSVVDEGLAHSIGSYSYTPKEAGLFFISTTLDPSDLIPALKTVIGEVSRLSREPVTEAELDKARTGTTADFIFDKETYDGRAESLGFFETATGSVDFEQRYLDGVDAVTSREILKTVGKYLTPENMTIVYLVPSTDSAAVTDEMVKAAALDAFSAPAAQEEALPSLVSSPMGYKAVLENGIRLVIREDHSLPIVSVVAVFDGGVRHETTSNNGINNLVARMLTRGTTKLTAGTVAERVDRIAADINGFSGRDTLGLKAEFLTAHQDEAWSLFSDLILDPSFDSDELSKVKEIVIAAIDRGKDNLPQRTLDLFKKTLYRDHPYSLPVLGTAKTVEGISRQDLVAYYRSTAVPERMVISVVGDVKPEEVLARVVELFGGLSGTGINEPVLPPVAGPARPIRVSETVTEKEQAHLFYGFLGTDYLSDDYHDMQVLTAVLSGMGGRLFCELREKEGLCYTVDAINFGGVGPGFLGAYMGTAPKNLSVAVNGIKKELSRIAKDGVSPEEMTRAKNYLIGNFELSLQKNLDAATTMATDELFGLGYDFSRRYPEKIEAVTASDVKRVAETYLNQEHSILSIVTPPF